MPDELTKLEMSEEQLCSLIEEVEKRYQPLREKIKKRRQHWNHDPEVNPDIGDQWKDTIWYQTDIPRRHGSKLKARLTENHFVVRVKPIRDIASQRQKANDLEQVFNTGLSFVEERERLDIQGALADAQIIDGIGWLHWRKADHIWPEVPEYNEVDDMPSCPMCEGTGKAAGKKCPECGGTGTTDGLQYTTDDYAEETGKTKTKKYRQTDQSLQQQREQDTAHAGFPWYIEVISGQAVSMVEDKSLENGAAIIVLRRIVPMLSYIESVQEEQKRTTEYADKLSMNEVNPNIPVYGEVDAPARDSVSGSDYAKLCSVVEVWTRKEFYELCDYSGVSDPGMTGSASGLKFVKGFKHGYGMPPFAPCVAQEINDPDPHNRYLPALEGVFRLKAMYDRLTALMLVLAEQTALPYYYWANVSTNQPLILEDGGKQTVTFQRNSALAEMAPEGYELRKVEFDVNGAFIQTVQHVREELEHAIPSTGTAEISASTQPWTVRLQQAQESVEPKRLVTNQARSISTMVRNQSEVMSKPAPDGFGEKITVFKTIKNGAVDETTVIGVDPEDIISLDVAIDIAAESSAERITKVQHGMELLSNNLITPPEFFEDYMGLDDGDEHEATLLAHAIYKEQILPMQSKQFVAKWLGTKFVMGPNGDLFGAGGQPVPGAQVLQANGQQPVAPPQPMQGPPGPPQPPPGMGGPPNPGMGPAMPSLPGLQGPPSAMPLAGMR